MTRLDELLDELTIDIPEAPTVAELRSRSDNRHRRYLPMVAVLLGMVVISGILVQLIGTGSPRRDPSADDVLASDLGFLNGPRSFEISIQVHANPVVRIRQFDLARWDWISEQPEAWGIRLDITSTVRAPVLLTVPTWERSTDDGVLFVANEICERNYFVCVRSAEVLTLPARQTAPAQTRVGLQPRLAPPGEYNFTTQFEYEVPTTGQRGTIPVDVTLRIWVPGGTKPAPDPSSTIMPPPPPSSTPTTT
jgi:hypothetical protein